MANFWINLAPRSGIWVDVHTIRNAQTFALGNIASPLLIILITVVIAIPHAQNSEIDLPTIFNGIPVDRSVMLAYVNSMCDGAFIWIWSSRICLNSSIFAFIRNRKLAIGVAPAVLLELFPLLASLIILCSAIIAFWRIRPRSYFRSTARTISTARAVNSIKIGVINSSKTIICVINGSISHALVKR